MAFADGEIGDTFLIRIDDRTPVDSYPLSLSNEFTSWAGIVTAGSRARVPHLRNIAGGGTEGWVYDTTCVDGEAPMHFVGSFAVNEGPPWADASSTSCVAACASLFGGNAADYGCSTLQGALNHRAHMDGWGDGVTYCSGGDAPEDFVKPAQGAAYDCGSRGCSYSAYVSDHGCAETNYCWRAGLQ